MDKYGHLGNGEWFSGLGPGKGKIRRAETRKSREEPEVDL